jgi:UDP-N-acetylmuramoylalanine--D-glutamate ligase
MSLGFRGKTVFVYGLGLSGQAAVDALVVDGAKVWAWDDGKNAVLQAGSQAKIINPAEVDWQQVDAVLKSPGVPETTALMQAALGHNVPILGDVDLLYRQAPDASYIGVTGTNGKSTTTALIGHILQCAGYNVAVGGNLGQAPLSLPVLDEDGLYVLELSSYQLELLRETELDAGVLLNLSPDHLERHGSMEAYMAAKLHLFEQCTPTASKVMGIDHSLLEAAAGQTGAQTLSLAGREADYKITRDGKLMHRGKQLADLSYFDNLPGPHNWQNITCALLAVRPWVEKETFFRHLRSFVGLPHRLEKVTQLQDLAFVNDSKATNSDATIPALRSFKNIYWIAGGQPKAEGVAPCLPHLGNVRAAFLLGQAQEDFAHVLEPHIPVFRCHTLEQATREAYAAARQENLAPACVLLSPACASWDQFESFEQRGDIFASLCRQLVSERAAV